RIQPRCATSGSTSSRAVVSEGCIGRLSRASANGGFHRAVVGTGDAEPQALRRHAGQTTRYEIGGPKKQTRPRRAPFVSTQEDAQLAASIRPGPRWLAPLAE